jgi:hypothetical protein
MRTNVLLAICLATPIGLGWTEARAQRRPPPPPPANLEVPVGPPTGMLPTNNQPFEMKLMVVDKNGKPQTRTVRIPSNPADPNQPPIMIWRTSGLKPMETLRQRAERHRNERAEFARKKAAAIAYAINKEFKDVFEGLGKEATVGVESVTDKYGDPNYPDGMDQFWGLITVPKVPQTVNPKTGAKDGVMFVKNPMGEGGDGTRFQQSSSSSMGSIGTMGRGDGSTNVATGYDGNDEPSFIELGLKDTYVATLMPTPGMTDIDILLALEIMLDSNGVPATFDPGLFQLRLDEPILDGDTFAFGNTDAGLDFMVSFQGAYVIPEPGSAVLVALGMLAAGMASRRRRR